MLTFEEFKKKRCSRKLTESKRLNKYSQYFCGYIDAFYDIKEEIESILQKEEAKIKENQPEKVVYYGEPTEEENKQWLESYDIDPDWELKNGLSARNIRKTTKKGDTK